MDKHGGLIRLGLALYGLWPSLATKVRGERLGINLKPVLSWQTKVIQLKKSKPVILLAIIEHINVPKTAKLLLYRLATMKAMIGVYQIKRKCLFKTKDVKYVVIFV